MQAVTWRDISEEARRRILQRAKEKINGTDLDLVNWTKLAQVLGVKNGHTTLKYNLNPAYAEEQKRRTARQKAAREKEKARRIAAGEPPPLNHKTPGFQVHTPIPETEFRRRIAEIPRDTRTLTGKLLGDPLPGRSALDCGHRAIQTTPIRVSAGWYRSRGATRAGA